ncbi:exodeoxyribonuclease V subunit alpha [Mumia zhuanghuii]|uniref:RecBCD enzyme subunit RecD n=1 Tax=Mumia zhuanghuii TaxID=2585211 RepID=A0A5C4N2M3_9ACTN|nr:exodeoxyribonuclease V subunit alpha [Mumia zhuanghuii]TNC44651.1 exodeoxyribonuclease V subunit alpha [Mumia zhuanghuii]TNC51033.1 exodeoxyribonuclease V subunit alpha [Mumia zhuanghuii]
MTATTGASALSITAEGRLQILNEAGFLDGSDCVVTARICRQLGEDVGGDAALALAFAVRAVRDGSTALSLDSVAALTADLDEEGDVDSEPPTVGGTVALPEPGAWLDTVRSSALVAAGVLRVDLGLVYLDRYHADERLIADALRSRRAAAVRPVDPAAVEEVVREPDLDQAQKDAVRGVAERATTVLTGGPGMGKTHTIDRVLRALGAGRGQALRIGLAAPTGKAAARMNEMIEADPTRASSVSPAVTLHRLLGSIPGTSQRFRHDARNPLPHDLVIVDEASMVSLSMMARLIDALAPDARLLLVGDPDQLASVEAGSVLADLVRGLESDGSVVRLTQNHRVQGARADLAAALQVGDPDAVLASVGGDGVRFVETEAPSLDVLPEVVEHAVRLRELAVSGDVEAALAHLDSRRLLCAHRTGPFGTRHWNQLIERALAERVPEVALQPMYIGRPILVTRNDYGLGVRNGDAGVIVRTDDGPMAVIQTATGPLRLSPWRLSDIETMHAMTVHKAQGSQAKNVVVIVPPPRSRLLAREMLYTAVTRAASHLTIVGSRDAVRGAVQTTARRSSGLAERLIN